MIQSAKKTVRFALFLVVLTSCIGCDQATKRIATQTLKYSPPIRLMGDTIRIQYAENRGGFLGFGSSRPEDVRFVLLTLTSAALLFALMWILLTRWSMSRIQFIAYALMLAGGLGNLIDRVMHNGFVVDFLNIGIGPFRTGIFNVADVAITAGLLGLLYASRAMQSNSSASKFRQLGT